MAEKANRIPFTAAAQREGKRLTLVLSGYIWPENSNAAAAIAQELLTLEDGDELTCVLRNLYGGDTDESVTIHHDLKAYKPRMVLDGAVCSSGTFIMLAGVSIEATAHSKAMTHRPTGGASGDFEDMRSRADQNEGIYNEMAAMYAARTGMTPDECKALFMPKGKDVWFTAAKLLELKLVDKITEGSSLRSTVAMKELRKERDPENILTRFAACLDEAEVVVTENNDPKQSTMKETAKLLGLAETATEAEINAALDKRLKDGDAAKLRVETMEKDQATAMKAELTALLDGAMKDNAITQGQKDQVMKAADKDVAVALDMARVMVPAAKPHATIAGQLGTGKDSAAAKKEAEREDWSYHDYMMKDPKALELMRNKDNAAFIKLRQAHVETLKEKQRK